MIDCHCLLSPDTVQVGVEEGKVNNLLVLAQTLLTRCHHVTEITVISVKPVNYL